MVVLAFADIFGRPGRKAVAAVLPKLKSQYNPHFILANVENLAGGRGVNRRTLQELIDIGFSAFTLGNHIWDNREVYQLLESEPRLIRPANLPSPPENPCPGKGHVLLRSGNEQLFVINLMGRVFMDDIDCPFQVANRTLKEAPPNVPILVDMHADATSEKYAMGWHLAGRVAAVIGSHSHVQTADERILPGGTAYITDVGMSGSFDSVIGLRPQEVVQRFITRRPQGYHPAKDNPGISAVVIEIKDNRKAGSIERLRYTVDSLDLSSDDLE